MTVSFAHIAVIYNPSSGRPRERLASVNRFASLLREAGRTVTVLPTLHPNHATELAREAVAQGCDLVIAHGGDGTVNEVLQTLVGTDAVLGFWPGGTANVLAAELDFPFRVGDVVDRILAGNVRTVTVGKANDRYFLLMAGVGLDAAVVGTVDPVLKRRLGKGAFAVSALKFIWNWNLQPFTVQMNGDEVNGRFVVAGNGRSYGGGFQLTPLASLDDPDLDICVFSSGSRLDYLKYATASIFGSHRQMPGVIYKKVRRVRITAEGRVHVPVQLDGEVTGTLPLQLEAVPGGVKLLV